MEDENKDTIYKIQLEKPKDSEKERAERLEKVLPTERKLPRKFIIFLDILVNAVIVIVLYFFIKEYLIAPFRVIGPSMCNTLNFIDRQCEYGAGEYLILNKAVYHDFFGRRFGAPTRGDIIVFHPPQDDKNFYIKRIIGMPGETVEIKSGKVFVSGKELSELYLSEENQGKTEMEAGKSKFKVPSDGYFVLGDNRKESVDARNCFSDPQVGNCDTGRPFYLTLDEIEGKAWVVLLPFSNIRVIKGPQY